MVAVVALLVRQRGVPMVPAGLCPLYRIIRGRRFGHHCLLLGVPVGRGELLTGDVRPVLSTLHVLSLGGRFTALAVWCLGERRGLLCGP